MAVVSNKRSVMTMFSDARSPYSHRVRMVLAEKSITVEIVDMDPTDLSGDIMDLNPYGTLPTLVDRDLVLFESRIIMEYLDERFPHPPLLPVDPVSRATSRLFMHRVDQDWYSLMDQIFKGGKPAQGIARGTDGIRADFCRKALFHEHGIHPGGLLHRPPALEASDLGC